jgi:hypothetical protein
MNIITLQKTLNLQPGNGSALNVATAVVILNGVPAAAGTNVTFRVSPSSQSYFSSPDFDLCQTLMLPVVGEKGQVSALFFSDNACGETVKVEAFLQPDLQTTPSASDEAMFVFSSSAMSAGITSLSPSQGDILAYNADVYAEGTGEPALSVCIGKLPVLDIPLGGNATIFSNGVWLSKVKIPTDTVGTQALYLSVFENRTLFSAALIRYLVQ